VGFGGGECHGEGEDGKGLVQYITSGRVTGEDVSGLRGCKLKLRPLHTNIPGLYISQPTRRRLAETSVHNASGKRRVDAMCIGVSEYQKSPRAAAGFSRCIHRRKVRGMCTEPPSAFIRARNIASRVSSKHGPGERCRSNTVGRK